MTHDDLVQFAAEKLNTPIEKFEVYTTALVNGEFEVAMTEQWVESDRNWSKVNEFNLISWDLMGKGLEAFSLMYNTDVINLNDLLRQFGAMGLPLAFWEAWYKVERGGAAS